MAVLLLLLLSSGCRSDPHRDAFLHPQAGVPDQEPTHTLLYYLPNRFIDLLDIVHIGYGQGVGLGAELHLTRYARIGAVAGVDIGIAWLGRKASPFQAAAESRLVFGPYLMEWRSEVGTREYHWDFPAWDLGIYLHTPTSQYYVALAPDEILDFLLGWSTFDSKRDDW